MPAIPVTVLGPAESGKTVYLASLFRRLAIPRPDLGFHAQLPEQSTRLNRIYQQITSPDAWPDPQRRADISNGTSCAPSAPSATRPTARSPSPTWTIPASISGQTG
ncbi:hypothetical protein GCM10009601_49150 [Streptomyces thermospinosisporus]|uniref:ATP-binding protein n=1 Tax=Streptomyces thermospinosisporus TaxID=161482 RepID=A0ABN1Z452_9ACTN